MFLFHLLLFVVGSSKYKVIFSICLYVLFLPPPPTHYALAIAFVLHIISNSSRSIAKTVLFVLELKKYYGIRYSTSNNAKAENLFMLICHEQKKLQPNQSKLVLLVLCLPGTIMFSFFTQNI